MVMKKRGQITVFIVIGIVILFAVGFVLYAATIQEKLRQFTTKETEIEQFIGSCINDVSKEAIQRIGVTGGYLDVPQEIQINPRSYLSFAPNTEPKIPLWYYRGEQRIPSRKSIEQQISRYVSSNINTCINDFAAFKDRFTVRSIGNITTETTIADTSVFVKVTYPVEAQEKSTGILSRTQPVGRSIDVKLGRIHDMAIDILRSENEKTFFENLTMDLLATNIDFPLTGLDFSCTPKTWRKSELVTFAKNMIYYNIRKVTVDGNRVSFFDINDAYAQNNFLFKLDNKYRDIGAAFFYPQSSRFDLHVQPNDREVLRSNVGKSDNVLLRAANLCINEYHFTYDIEYPLLVTLKDDSAFSKTGFIFNFAFPVTINHNAGDKNDIPQTIFDTQEESADFCDSTASQVTDIRVKDFYTLEELYKADVDYKCVRMFCPLGQTKEDVGSYRLRTQLPARCSNGILEAHKDGYLDGETTYDESGNAEILLKPLKKFKVSFDKRDSDNLGKSEALLKGDSVVLFIHSDTEDFEQSYSTDSPGELSLIEGDQSYQIEALLVQDGSRLIGGYVGTWSVSYGDLAGANEITFHMVQKTPVAVTLDQQADTSAYVYDNQDYQARLKPTFK